MNPIGSTSKVMIRCCLLPRCSDSSQPLLFVRSIWKVPIAIDSSTLFVALSTLTLRLIFEANPRSLTFDKDFHRLPCGDPKMSQNENEEE